MPRRAEWRRSPDDPRTFLGTSSRWLRELLRAQGTPEVTSRFFVPGVLILIFGPPLLVGFWVGSGLGAIAGIVTGAFFLYATMRLPGLLSRRFYNQPLGSFERLLPLPLPEGIFPVYVAIHYKRSIAGMDEASAAFVDGWLHVEGARTSFSLRQGDGQSTWDRGVLRLTLSGEECVSIWPVDDRTLKPDARAFREAAEAWIAQAERPEGEPILPPLGTHPIMRKGWSFATAAGGLVMLLLLPLIEWVNLGLLNAPLVVLAFIGEAFFMRGMFVTKDHEEADRTARALESSRRALSQSHEGL